ncbi:hypothetical protein VP01_2404g3 [Puccinia sorghi]|uniref:Uncharacterized protein n=1 Tax=Puccinia sorghi TaxID=27349 RepID=A0A0L6V6U3_9BASI|nr:hypothetical protein VP01_2404g3 [Puccinia sorghi]
MNCTTSDSMLRPSHCQKAPETRGLESGVYTYNLLNNTPNQSTRSKKSVFIVFNSFSNFHQNFFFDFFQLENFLYNPIVNYSKLKFKVDINMISQFFGCVHDCWKLSPGKLDPVDHISLRTTATTSPIKNPQNILSAKLLIFFMNLACITGYKTFHFSLFNKKETIYSKSSEIWSSEILLAAHFCLSKKHFGANFWSHGISKGESFNLFYLSDIAINQSPTSWKFPDGCFYSIQTLDPLFFDSDDSVYLQDQVLVNKYLPLWSLYRQGVNKGQYLQSFFFHGGGGSTGRELEGGLVLGA